MIILWREMFGYIFLAITLLQGIEDAKGAGPAMLRPLPSNRKTLAPTPPRKWMTLTGSQPEVVAQGGYSGLFPDSSEPAFKFALDVSLAGTILYCNLHFAKDNEGFCIPDINLANCTNIQDVDPQGRKMYDIYGFKVHGWFGLDYPSQFLYENVTLSQNIFTRQPVFDGELIVPPSYILSPTRLWVNVENDLFYNQHKISPKRFLLEQLKQTPEFISSPEIGFLKAIGPQLSKAKTKLIFVFLEETRLEPTTNTAYGVLFKDLPMIKSFASGIVVPKEYIWPVSKDRILLPATNLVQDAHKLGLTVYASGFANDNLLSYNYSYDPAREYLQFVDNSLFSVDGLLSPFPSTASEAIGCLNLDKNATREIRTLIISHNGASGDYPGATDLAYLKAIDDGADIIDCSVQMSKDGTAFCSDQPDLLRTTTAAALYMDLSTNIPDIQAADGVFSFDLEWREIQSLKPQMVSPFDGELVRNPAHRNSGKIVTFAEFLELAKTGAVSGVLISIKNAAFLAKRGLDVVGTVEARLKTATLDKQRVLIESDDTSVLLKFKDKPNYQRVLHVHEAVGGVPEQVAKEIKKYADAVSLHRDAIIVGSESFVGNFTNTVQALHAANISVYVGYLKNEFANLNFDYLSDPYVELATFHSLQVDGFVTEYPATASMFARSSCMANGSTYTVRPVQPGLLYSQPHVKAPPLLSNAQVVDPPLPAVAKKNFTSVFGSAASHPPSTGTQPPLPPGQKSSSPSITASATGSVLAATLTLVKIFT